MQKLDPTLDIIGGDGVVSISVESGRKINLPKDTIFSIRDLFNVTFQNLILYVRNGEFSRSFKPVSFDGGYPCWNQKLNIPVHVYPTKNHPLNSLIFTLEVCNVFPNNEESRQIIGSLILHLYDIIPLNELEDSFDFYQNHSNIIGSVGMKIKFMYGTFGYGYSMQINDQLLQSKSKNKNILFPRIEPKSFGEDFIHGNNMSIDEVIEKNREIEEKYANHIEYLFGLGEKKTTNKETRKFKLQSLKDLVEKENSNTASINLDENFYTKLEQTAMLKRNLIPKK